MNRIPRFASALGAALLLLAGAARAEAADSESEFVHGLDGGAPYRIYSSDGLGVRTAALEYSRRAMIKKHCSALDKDFPNHSSPPMAAAADAMQKWMLGGHVEGVPDNKSMSVGLQGMRLLIEAVFTPRELAEWDRFRHSAQGQRGINIAALFSVTEDTAEATDLHTGVAVDWPLANLREMADAAKLRPYLDKALEQVAAGNAAALAKLSIVPGENRDDAATRKLRETFFDHWETLEVALRAQMTQADKQAVEALMRQPVYRRWPEIAEAWSDFVSPKPFPGPVKLQTVAEFCGKLKLAACQADSPLAQSLEKARNDSRSIADKMVEVDYSDVIDNVPGTGCQKTKP
jgi:hypothetical protein